MTIPNWPVFMKPLLDEMAGGGQYDFRKLDSRVAASMGFSSKELAEKIPSGEPRTLNRIRWAVNEMFRAGLLSRPSRGFYAITPAGAHLHATGASVTVADLKKYPQYLEYTDPELRKARRNAKPLDEVSGTITPPMEQLASESTPQELLERAASELNEALVSEIFSVLQTVGHAAFELLILRVVQAMGYGTEDGIRQTGGTGDKGIDGIIWQDALGFDRVYLQAKRYSKDNNVQSKDVRDFGGALMQQRAAKGIFITTSQFTAGATEAAREISHSAYNIVLIDGKRLATLMFKYGVGVQSDTTVTTYRLDGEFFDDLDMREAAA